MSLRFVKIVGIWRHHHDGLLAESIGAVSVLRREAEGGSGESGRDIKTMDRNGEMKRNTQKAFIPNVKVTKCCREKRGNSETRRWKETGTSLLLNPTQRDKVLFKYFELHFSLLTSHTQVHTVTQSWLFRKPRRWIANTWTAFTLTNTPSSLGGD